MVESSSRHIGVHCKFFLPFCKFENFLIKRWGKPSTFFPTAHRPCMTCPLPSLLSPLSLPLPSHRPLHWPSSSLSHCCVRAFAHAALGLWKAPRYHHSPPLCKPRPFSSLGLSWDGFSLESPTLVTSFKIRPPYLFSTRPHHTGVISCIYESVYLHVGCLPCWAGSSMETGMCLRCFLLCPQHPAWVGMYKSENILWVDG